MILTIVLILLVLCVLLGVGLYMYTCWNPASKRCIPADYKLDPRIKKNREMYENILAELKNVPFEQVDTRSEDGLLLQARYYHTADDAPFAILMHGYRSSCFCDFLLGCNMMREQGYNVLLIDERACGLSEGKSISFGIMERRDCLSWIRYLTGRFGEDIKVVLYGVSMGSATVMMASGMEDLPGNVKAVIADCGYTSPKQIITCVADRMKIPGKMLYPFCRIGTRLLAGFDLNSASAIEAVRKTSIPILFIHGEDDDFVPFGMCGQLYQACCSEKELLTVPEAGHANSILRDTELYKNRVAGFLKEHV